MVPMAASADCVPNAKKSIAATNQAHVRCLPSDFILSPLYTWLKKLAFWSGIAQC
jgi:hypothetical protein